MGEFENVPLKSASSLCPGTVFGLQLLDVDQFVLLLPVQVYVAAWAELTASNDASNVAQATVDANARTRGTNWLLTGRIMISVPIAQGPVGFQSETLTVRQGRRSEKAARKRKDGLIGASTAPDAAGKAKLPSC